MDWGIDVVPFSLFLLLVASVTPMMDQVLKICDDAQVKFKAHRRTYANV